MATAKQDLGALGEQLVVQNCACPCCKRSRTLKTLPPNFKCADVICDFCGYLGQVKASTSADGITPPPKLPGAAWGPQQERMASGIYFPLFLVLVAEKLGRFSIHYLSADLQTAELFLERDPLGPNARRKGWTGFRYDLGSVRDRLILLVDGKLRRRRGGTAAGQSRSPSADSAASTSSSRVSS
ncbi:MAG: type restriction enzyme [Sphingomonadales bacterium]|jgi:type II restriction enzyme|nr:type restriction enzyme [Sphingomonadales bacterium]